MITAAEASERTIEGLAANTKKNIEKLDSYIKRAAAKGSNYTRVSFYDVPLSQYDADFLRGLGYTIKPIDNAGVELRWN